MQYFSSKPLILIASLLFFLSSYANGQSASVIEAKANDAIIKFIQEVEGGKKFLSRAKGYLVFPSVVKGGYIFGGEYGEGVLRIDGKTKDYYSIASGSVGLQFGIQQSSYIIAFVSESVLQNFIHSNGWEAGVDGSVAFVKWGAGKDIGSLSFEKPIYAFVFDSKGLMYNLTIEGTKFTRIIPR